MILQLIILRVQTLDGSYKIQFIIFNLSTVLEIVLFETEKTTLYLLNVR